MTATIKLDVSENTEWMCSRLLTALDMYERAGGELPVRLVVHPFTYDNMDSGALSAAADGRARFVRNEAAPAGTITLKPKGHIYA